MYGGLLAIARTSGPGSAERKIQLLVSLLHRCSPVEARYLIRFVTGRWRLGVGPLTVLEAVARCFPESNTARVDLERAYNLCSDLGLVLKTVRQSGLKALQRFRVRVGNPVRVLMAERLPSAEAIIERLRTCSVESKLDGFRCELHIKNKRVEIFSRNMERTTLMFPDLVAAARKRLGPNSAIVEWRSGSDQ
jgi:DNA ligase 1